MTDTIRRRSLSLIWAESIKHRAGDWCPGCHARIAGRFGSRHLATTHVETCDALTILAAAPLKLAGAWHGDANGRND